MEKINREIREDKKNEFLNEQKLKTLLLYYEVKYYHYKYKFECCWNIYRKNISYNDFDRMSFYSSEEHQCIGDSNTKPYYSEEKGSYIHYP